MPVSAAQNVQVEAPGTGFTGAGKKSGQRTSAWGFWGREHTDDNTKAPWKSNDMRQGASLERSTGKWKSWNGKTRASLNIKFKYTER